MANLGYTHYNAKYSEVFENFATFEIERQFIEAAAKEGLRIGNLIADGKIHRCGTVDKPKSKNGAYCLWIDDGPPAGWFQNWRKESGPVAWSLKSVTEMSPAQQAEYKDACARKAAEREAEKELGEEAAAVLAGERWRLSKILFEGNAYLSKKKIGKHHSRLFGAVLQIPLFDASGTLVNLQAIFPEGMKRPISGGKYKEIYSLIGAPKDAPIICVAEGFATAASIHEATGYPVYIAIQCHNLTWTAAHAKNCHPSARVIVCGDTDHDGYRAAMEAARVSLGDAVFPPFPIDADPSWNDFNDLATNYGIDAVKYALQRKEKITEDDIEAAIASLGYYFDGDIKPERRIAIIKRFLPRDGTGIVGGQSGTGKTFIAVDMAVAISTGQPFFGEPVRTRVGVAYLAAEGGGSIADRIAAAKRARGITETIPVIHSDKVGDLLDEKNLEEKISAIQSINGLFENRFGVPLGVIIIDTISQAFHMDDESSNAEAAHVCRILADIAERTGCFVVAVHHYGKDKEKGLRGASAWRGNVDQVFAITGECDENRVWKSRSLIVEKNRDGEEGRVGEFDLCRVEVRKDSDGDPVSSMIVRAMLEKVLAKTAEKGPTQARRSVHEAIKKSMEAAAFEHTTEDGQIVRAVAIISVKQHFASIYPINQPDPAKRKEALRKAYERGLDSLLEAGIAIIGKADGIDIVWFV